MKFEVGKKYSCRSLCDYNTVFDYTVISRTAKQITISTMGGVTKRGVKLDSDGSEMCYPEGRYSMCPVIKANRAVM